MNWTAKLGIRNIAIALIALIILGAVVSKNLNSEEKFVSGETCQSLEEVRDQSDIKYICLPNEKGLIWVNQASTAKYALGPAGRLVYRYIDSKQQRLSQVRGWFISPRVKPPRVPGTSSNLVATRSRFCSNRIRYR